MAAPSYTSTDLFDIDLAEASTGYSNIGTGAVSQETDYYIQGSACVSKVGWTAATRGIIFNDGADRASQFANDAAFIAWVEYHNANLLDTYANGGIRLIIGSGTGAYYEWYVGGSDTIPYAGWHAYAVDPTVDTNGDSTAGSPTATQQYFGVTAKVLGSGSLKGNPLGLDVMRIGREGRAEFGDAGNGYATLAGMEAYQNDASRRWGLLFNREGAFYAQGGLIMGTSSNAVDWRDSDRVIFYMDSPKVATTFNTIEVRNASSRVDWDRYTVKVVKTVPTASTNANCQFIVVDNADVNINACAFVDMDTFTLQANSAFLDCTFIRCARIDPGGGSLAGSTITASTVAADEGAVYWNNNTDPSGELDNMTFSKGANAHHAIRFGTTSPTTVTLNGIAFGTSWNASNGNNDSTLRFDDRGSDTTWTVNTAGCTGTITYKKMRAGDTVNVVNSTTLELTGLKNPTEIRVYDEGTTTEIAGQENVTTGTFSTGIDAATYPLVDISVIALGYQNLRFLSVDMSSDQSIPVVQQLDRQYNNP
jgi:hypothetical protein